MKVIVIVLLCQNEASTIRVSSQDTMTNHHWGQKSSQNKTSSMSDSENRHAGSPKAEPELADRNGHTPQNYGKASRRLRTESEIQLDTTITDAILPNRIPGHL